MFEKLKDFVLGKPKAHVVPVKQNRKQRREQQHILRKRAAAKKRRKYEKR